MDVGKEDMDGAWDRIKRIMLQDAAEAHGIIKYEEGDLVEWWSKSGNGFKKKERCMRGWCKWGGEKYIA